VVPGLTRLKTRYIVSPLSNGNVALLANMAKRAGLPWDLVLGAETSGAYKPLPQAYLRAAAMLALEPEQVMLAAAHNDDLRAARAVGLKTGFVPRPLEYGAGQKKDLGPSEPWDIVASDFGDLAARLAT
jgi:2-haloacid dehalogenase